LVRGWGTLYIANAPELRLMESPFHSKMKIFYFCSAIYNYFHPGELTKVFLFPRHFCYLPIAIESCLTEHKGGNAIIKGYILFLVFSRFMLEEIPILRKLLVRLKTTSIQTHTKLITKPYSN
jgi:phosphotransferase system  glucose/maltose/N-acetylglucosamine-specific IIC component